ncbi:hypothetical protein RQP46_002117 [Phenoliferia psychrophenolica]
MKSQISLVATSLLAASASLGAVLPRQAPTVPGVPSIGGPLVALPYSTFQGRVDANGVESFLGMPYAQPPIGDLRLRRPVTPPKNVAGVVQATQYGPACVQMSLAAGALDSVPATIVDMINANPVFAPVVVNVNRPAGITSNDSIPIVSPFCLLHATPTNLSTSRLFGSTYPHHDLITRSVQLGTPVLHISMNYRLNAYGFLAGKEVKAAGVANLGLQDQRAALRWGESAGAVSVGLQMVSKCAFSPAQPCVAHSLTSIVDCSTAQSEKNFRAAFMDSGGVLSVGSSVGCSAANDTLDYGGLHFVYEPGTDDNFFTADPQVLLQQGKYARVPAINGDCDDEGTLFSLTQPNVTTDADFQHYLKQVWLPNANASEIASVAAAYPADAAAGSPFDTGALNQLHPSFKRISAFQGDSWFHAPRRYLLNTIYKTQPVWSFLYKRQKLIPFLGSFHSSDLQVETGISEASNVPPVDWSYYDSLINLAVHLDPNTPADRAPGVSPLIQWPTWTPGGSLLTYVDAESNVAGDASSNLGGLVGGVVATPPRGLVLTLDTFRTEAMKIVNDIFLKYPF